MLALDPDACMHARKPYLRPSLFFVCTALVTFSDENRTETIRDFSCKLSGEI